jgi:hypothetical protein
MGESGHSPALVGKHFIMNYYTILHDEPQSLYKFYKDDSVYSFGTEGEPLSPESTVTGQSVRLYSPPPPPLHSISAQLPWSALCLD